MFESNTDSMDLRAMGMLFVLEAITREQEEKKNTIAHSAPKLQAGSATEDERAETLTPKFA